MVSIKTILQNAQKLKIKSMFQQSFDEYAKVKQLAESEYNFDLLTEALIGMAHTSRMIGNFEQSQRYYSYALDLAESEGDVQTVADCHVGIGLALKGICLWKDALYNISKAKTIYKRAKDIKAKNYAIWAEGTIYRVAGDIKKSIECFQKSLKGFEETKFTWGKLYCYCGLGGSYRIAGDTGKSMYYYRLANGLSQSARDRFAKAYSYCGIGNGFRMELKYRQAEKEFKRALRIYNTIGDIVSSSYTLWSYANIYKHLGDLGKAMQFLHTAKDSFEKTGDIRGIVYCEMTDAEILYLKDQRDEAYKKIDFCITKTTEYELKLESQHSQLIKDLFDGRDIGRHIKAYEKLGVNIKSVRFPLNIP